MERTSELATSTAATARHRQELVTGDVRRMGFVEDIYGPQIEEEEQSANVYEYQNTPENRSWAGALPVKQGLYDPELEKDACGVGFAAYVARGDARREDLS